MAIFSFSKRIEDKEVLENIKLIVEFMGAKGVKIDYARCQVTCDYQQEDPNKFGYIPAGITPYTPIVNRYYNCWDVGLMDVVHKIESIKSDGRNWDYVVVIERNYCVISLHGESVISEVQDTTKELAVFNAIVEFINWYNAFGKDRNKRDDEIVDLTSTNNIKEQ